LARASPSRSQSSGIGSPSSSVNPTSNPQSLTKIVIAQVFLLISSLKEEDKAKWENQAEQLRKLIDANGMEVFTKYFRRLLQNNAGQIFPGAGRASENPSSYSILMNEVRKLSEDSEQAFKIAESLDTPEGDLFKDFDLATFVDHFNLPDYAKINLALAVKSTASKADLRAKGTVPFLTPHHLTSTD
jgi:CCR4-NOT transcription complex subunit 1